MKGLAWILVAGIVLAEAGAPLKLTPDESDTILILGGLLDGVAAGVGISNIEGCVTNAEDTGYDLFEAVTLFMKQDPTDVKQAINDLGQAMEVIPSAIRDCASAYEEDAADIEQMLSVFESPMTFVFTVGKNLVLNGNDIYDDMSTAMDDWTAANWYGFGQNVGEALAKTFLSQRAIVEAINGNPNSSWTAKKYPHLAGKTAAAKKSLLGTTIMDMSKLMPTKTYSKEVTAALPTAFDCRTQWPNCIHPILNQGDCGSCWAFGSSETLSDRFCIASNGASNIILSPQDLVNCSPNMGCSGGYLYTTWLWMETYGIASMPCVPYVSGTTTTREDCTSTCTNTTTTKVHYRARKLGTSLLPTADDIKADMYLNGPVHSAFLVYEDFMNYESGVYSHTTGSYLGGHSIKIVGWGVANTVNYWIVANSWGTDWGQNGFFWIKQGDCMIDVNGLAGEPQLTA